MNVLPYQRSTMVLPHPVGKVVAHLRAVSCPPDASATPDADGDVAVFNGVVRARQFRISRRLYHYQNFLPLMHGHVEATSRGSILFVRYRMFPGALLFLAFSCALVLSIGIYFLVAERQMGHFLASLLLLVFNYAVAVAGFNRQVHLSRKLLERVVNSIR